LITIQNLPEELEYKTFYQLLTNTAESIKEELSAIIKEHIEETKLMKEEIKLMTIGLKRIKKKK